MSTTPTGSNFAWVLVAPDPKGYNPSKVDRHAIRRQAMKTVSAGWRQSSEHGRINIGQYPVFANNDKATPSETVEHGGARASSDPTPESMPMSRSSTTTALRPTRNLTQIPILMPLSGTERLRAMFGVYLLNLSPLTVTHVGSAVQSFFTRPTRLVSLLREHKSSYLSHIPSRLGHNQCLDNAIYALYSKTREILSPFNPDFRTITLAEHGRALRNLQQAIDDPISRMEADVLCATELLGLIEVLNLSEENAWTSHISGASQLVQMRGPDGFKSAYEMDLFVSLIGPIICEAIRKNEFCFLEQECWQEALDSIIIPEDSEISERSSVSISIRKIVAYLPRVFRDVSSAICHSNDFSDLQIHHLISRIRKLRQGLLQHLVQLRGIYLNSESDPLSFAKTDIFYEILGSDLIALIMANRLLSAVGDVQGEAFEHDALLYASEIMKLHEEMIFIQGWASFYLNQKATLAMSVSATTDIWEVAPGKIIEKWRFDSWCKAIHRQTCCNFIEE